MQSGNADNRKFLSDCLEKSRISTKNDAKGKVQGYYLVVPKNLSPKLYEILQSYCRYDGKVEQHSDNIIFPFSQKQIDSFHVYLSKLAPDFKETLGDDYFLKTIRADKRDYFRSIYRHTVTRTSIKDNYIPLRIGEKKRYTTQADGVYARHPDDVTAEIPLRTPMYSSDEKRFFSKPQSTVFVTKKTRPRFFGFNSRQVLLGVVHHKDNARITNKLSNRDFGSVKRRVDRNNPKKAIEQYHRHYKGMFYNDLDKFKAAIDNIDYIAIDKYNEAFVRLKWDERCFFVINTDTLISRLITQERARIMRQTVYERSLRLNESEGIPEAINNYVPACYFYINDDENRQGVYYSEIEQALDRHKGLKIYYDKTERHQYYHTQQFQILYALDSPESIIDALNEEYENESLWVHIIRKGYMHVVQSLLDKAGENPYQRLKYKTDPRYNEREYTFLFEEAIRRYDDKFVDYLKTLKIPFTSVSKSFLEEFVENHTKLDDDSKSYVANEFIANIQISMEEYPVTGKVTAEEIKNSSKAINYRKVGIPLLSVYISEFPEFVSRILESKPDGIMLDMTDPQGLTPLFYAIKNNKVDIFTSLIEKGADIHALTDNNENCLYAVCNALSELTTKHIQESPDVETNLLFMLGRLLINGCSTTIKSDDSGKDAFELLLSSHNPRRERYINHFNKYRNFDEPGGFIAYLKYKYDANNLGNFASKIKKNETYSQIDRDGKNAFSYVRTLDDFNFLIKRGVDLTVIDNNGNNYLHNRLKMDDADIIPDKIINAAPLEMLTAFNATKKNALMLALQTFRFEAAESITYHIFQKIKNKPREEALQILKGSLISVINVTNFFDNEIYHKVCNELISNILSKCVEYDKDLSVTLPEMIEILSALNPKADNTQIITVLQTFSNYSIPKIMDAIVESDLSVSQRELIFDKLTLIHGKEMIEEYLKIYSPLHVAFSNENYSMISKLIKTSPSLLDSIEINHYYKGMTPLAHVLVSQDLDLMRAILAKGGDAHALFENDVSQTSLTTLCDGYNLDIYDDNAAKAIELRISAMKLLLSHGAKDNTPYQGFPSIYEWAKSTGKPELLDLLAPYHQSLNLDPSSTSAKSNNKRQAENNEKDEDMDEGLKDEKDETKGPKRQKL